MDLLRSSISLRQLHYLVAIADAGSFSAAAEVTRVAQPALSRQIAALEAQVELRLLHRSRKGVTLTEGGARLYNLARSMLEQLDSVRQDLRASQRQPVGVVTIALPPSVASMLAPQVLREIHARYPQVILRIDDSLSLEGSRSLEVGLLDFGIVPAAGELTDVDYEPLVRESLLLIERRGAARRVAATITLDQVSRLKLILPPRTFHTRRTVDDAARVAGLTLNIGYEQRSITTIMGMVRDGFGATIANSPAVEQYWPRGSVIARRIVRPQITRTMSLARPSRRRLSFAAQAVYAIVKRFAIDAVEKGRWQGKLLC